MKAVWQCSTDGILLLNNHRKCVAANPAACRLLGRSRKTLLTMRLDDLVPTKDRSAVPAMWRMFMAQGRMKSLHVLRRADGAYRDVDCRCEAKVMPGLHMSVLHDVTEAKQALAAASLHSQIVQQIQEPILTTDLAGNIQSWNPAAERQVGYTAAEVLGRNLSFLYGPEDRPELIASLSEPLRPGGRCEFDVKGRRKSGEDFFGHLKVSPLNDSRGHAIGLIRSIVNETDRIQAERELRRSRNQLRQTWARARAVGEQQRRSLSRELHDQVGQSLLTLKMDVHWLQDRIAAGDRPEASARLQSMLEHIVATVKRVRRLSWSLRPILLDQFGLAAAVEEAAREFEGRSGIRCRVHSETDIDIPVAAQTEVFRIFEQALSNIAAHSSADSVKVRLAQSAESLVLTVVDNGVGIRDEAIASDYSLGLIGMHERAALCGGSLTVRRGKRVGTVVQATIPRAAGAGGAGTACDQSSDR